MLHIVLDFLQNCIHQWHLLHAFFQTMFHWWTHHSTAFLSHHTSSPESIQNAIKIVFRAKKL